MLNVYAMEERALALFERSIDQQVNFGLKPSAAFMVFNRSRPEMQIQNGTARIAVHGMLDNEASFFTGTSYQEIQSEIAQALQDDDVKDIVLDIDSPGGTLSGFIQTASILRDAREEKPIRAEIQSKATSGALGIAAQATEIVAMDPAGILGSIGVMVSSFVMEEIVSARSAKAPLKARQLNEPEGQESVQKLLDDSHDQFVAEIVAGRKITQPDITADIVNETFGRGGVMTARDAVTVGMIDKIDLGGSAGEGNVETVNSIKSNPNPKSSQDKSKESKQPIRSEGKIMDLKELQAEHPEVYRAAFELGHKEGVDIERDRVKAHLEMGKASGDMEASTKFILGGNALMESSVQSAYMSASIKSGVRTASEEESPETLGGAQAPGTKIDGEASQEDIEAEAAEILSLVKTS